MNPSRQELMELLELQKADSLIDRLTALRSSLPEQQRLDEAIEEATSLDHQIRAREAGLAEIAVRQSKLDHEIEMLSVKAKREGDRLYSGSVSSPKELSDLQREVEALKRRISSFEDSDLEVMEEREQAEGSVEALRRDRDRTEAVIAEAGGMRDQAASRVESELVDARAAREQVRPKIGEELLALYEDLRQAKGGVGAAALLEGVCQGCHMVLPSQEYERVRHAEGLVRCDECRRILVVL